MGGGGSGKTLLSLWRYAPRMAPGPKFIRLSDVRQVEVKAQMSAAGRAGIHLRFLEQAERRVFIHCKYDPGVIVEAHGHASDHALYVLAGSVAVGGEECGAGTLVVLEEGAVFGPLEAGPDGTELLEFYEGDPMPVPADPEGFARLLVERGVTPVDLAATREPAAGRTAAGHRTADDRRADVEP